MIIPPLSSKANYAVNLHGEVAHAALNQLLTLPEVIQQVYIVSKSSDTDIELTNEVSAAIQKLVKEEDSAAACETKFNPLYLPRTEAIENLVEYNEEGDVISIDGFTNPYTTISIEAISHERLVARAVVTLTEFDLPDLTTALGPSESKVN